MKINNKIKMAKTLKKQKFELAQLDANNIQELDGWKETQEQIVKENPFVEIVDCETYETAKSRRTALVSARTSIQKQDKTIASVISNFRKGTMEIAKQLIEITEPHEIKQQNEVSRYEAILEEKKREKERLEEERIAKIKTKISETEKLLDEVIDNMKFENISVSNKGFDRIIENVDFDFEEFEPMFDEMVFNKQTRLDEIAEQLVVSEKERLEQIKRDQEAKINQLHLKCLQIIDEANVDNYQNLDVEVGKVLETDFDFGEYFDQWNVLSKSIIERIKVKTLKIKEEIERQKKIREEENKNRINSTKQGLLDIIFQMDFENYNWTINHVEEALNQENPFPELQKEFDEMISVVKKNYKQKRIVVDVERKQVREAIDKRTEARGKQLESINYSKIVQPSENYWTHEIYDDYDIWESMIEGLSDEDWKEYFENLKNSIEVSMERDERLRKRKDRLKADKETLISQMEELKLSFSPTESDYDNEESIVLANEITTSLGLFVSSIIEKINKF